MKKAGTLWLYKVRALGLQKVHLKAMAPTRPGLFRVGVRAKRWFTAAAANQPAASTTLTVKVGTSCFSHVVTKKID